MKIKIATEKDIIKAYRRGSREAEIEMYGKPISMSKMHRNKVKYTRKNKYKEDYE
jgi:hypothetical protein